MNNGGPVDSNSCQSKYSTEKRTNNGEPKGSLWTYFVPLLFIFATVCVVLAFGKDSVKQALLHIESMNLFASAVLFLVLYTSVSFPLIWGGYVLLNVAGGYLYGVACGVFLAAICATCGVAGAHFVMRRFTRRCIEHLLIGRTEMQALLRVVSGRQALRLIFLARLTPVPFGVQNALFAVTGVSTSTYLVITFFGLLPTQALYTYVGSTLRSMEEVFTGDNNAMAWLVLAAQIVLSIGLMVFVARKAKDVLSETVREDQACAETMQKQCRDNAETTQAAEQAAACFVEIDGSHEYRRDDLTLL